MIKNSLISLKTDSKARLDAVNILKYTLFLDYQVPELNDAEEFISHLMDAVQSCCKGLFMDRTKDKGNIYYYFFGGSQDARDMNKSSCLSYLDVYSPTNDSNEFKGMAGLHTMILQHCVLSSYHAILTELLENQQTTSYGMKKKLKECGVQCLCKKNKLSFTEQGLTFHAPCKNSSNKDSANASDFSTKTKSHIEAIPDVMELLTIATQGKNGILYKYNLQFSEICYHICEINATKFRFLNNDNESKKSCDFFIDAIEYLTNKLEPGFDFSKGVPKKILGKLNGDVVDELYHYYIIERIFNFNLFYSLISNIYNVQNKTSYQLCQESIIDILTCCKELPNIFSRQYFLKYAFDKIIDAPSSYHDFWFKINQQKMNTIIGRDERDMRCFEFLQWIKQYKLFIRYMSKFVIPVYEWCFLDMLLEAIESKFPEKNHVSHLEYALNLLSDYMRRNYRSILCPINMKKEIDYVSIISEHKNISVLKRFPDDTILQVIHTLCGFNDKSTTSNDLDLNLPILNWEYFNDKDGNNYRKIRIFYTELMKDTYGN